MKGNIVVGQSGGPTAVINSSVAGVYAAAKKLGVKKVYVNFIIELDVLEGRKILTGATEVDTLIHM